MYYVVLIIVFVDTYLSPSSLPLLLPVPVWELVLVVNLGLGFRNHRRGVTNRHPLGLFVVSNPTSILHTLRPFFPHLTGPSPLGHLIHK